MRKALLLPALAIVGSPALAGGQQAATHQATEVLNVIGEMELLNVTSDLPIDEKASVGDNPEIDEILAAADEADAASEPSSEEDAAPESSDRN